MAKPKPPYRKLTRMSRSVGLMTQLWLGEDHLLQVQSTGYTEAYQRFYLRDIQALLLVHSSRRLYTALIVAGVALIPLLIALGNEAEWPVYAWIGGLTLPLLIWNQLLGPGCRVVVITAVQQEKLPSLSRVPKTRRVLAELKTLIEAAQADLTQPRATPASVLPATGAGSPVMTVPDESAGTSPELPPLIAVAPSPQPPALPPPLPPAVT